MLFSYEMDDEHKEVIVHSLISARDGGIKVPRGDLSRSRYEFAFPHGFYPVSDEFKQLVVEKSTNLFTMHPNCVKLVEEAYTVSDGPQNFSFYWFLRLREAILANEPEEELYKKYLNIIYCTREVECKIESMAVEKCPFSIRMILAGYSNPDRDVVQPFRTAVETGLSRGIPLLFPTTEKAIRAFKIGGKHVFA